MKKILLLLLVTVFLAAGCSPQAPNASPSPTVAAETSDVYVPASTKAAEQDYLRLGYDLMASDGLGDLRLGMMEAQVTALLGQPEQASAAVVWGADGLLHSTWDYPSKGISLGMAGESGGTEGLSAVSLSAMAPCALLTRWGIGIGR
jgi:hypothetical protein